jgi:hypothetical protein
MIGVGWAGHDAKLMVEEEELWSIAGALASEIDHRTIRHFVYERKTEVINGT